jgi:protein subunit release factor B
MKLLIPLCALLSRFVVHHMHPTSTLPLPTSLRCISTVIDGKDLIENFVRGSGPGGQKINKSKNNVHLLHTPTGISVQCQDARDLTTNRKIARKLLRDKIDLATNGKDSKLGKRHAKISKQKDKAARLVHE